MPSSLVFETGGAAASLIGVITELKAMLGICVVPPSKKYCSPCGRPLSESVTVSAFSSGVKFGSSLCRIVDMSTDTSPPSDSR